MSRRWLRFDIVVWIITFAAVLFLIGQPFFMDYWAGSHWNVIPCHKGGDTQSPDRYFYEVAGITYNSTRRDFWMYRWVNSEQKHAIRFQTESTCWVNPSDPGDSVLVLDAHRNFSHATARVCAALLVGVGALVLTRSGKKKRPGGGNQAAP